MHATLTEVFLVIMAYSLLINAVDKFFKVRASKKSTRKVQEIPVSIFIFLHDANIQNEYFLYRTLSSTDDNTRLSFREFEHRITESLVTLILTCVSRGAEIAVLSLFLKREPSSLVTILLSVSRVLGVSFAS